MRDRLRPAMDRETMAIPSMTTNDDCAHNRNSQAVQLLCPCHSQSWACSCTMRLCHTAVLYSPALEEQGYQPLLDDRI